MIGAALFYVFTREQMLTDDRGDKLLIYLRISPAFVGISVLPYQISHQQFKLGLAKNLGCHKSFPVLTVSPFTHTHYYALNDSSP